MADTKEKLKEFEHILYGNEGVCEDWNNFTIDFTSEPFKDIVNFLEEKKPPPHSLALDVACGAGQSAMYMLNSFDHVEASDVNSHQVEACKKRLGKFPNISFRVSGFEDMGAADQSVDCVVSSEAAHWFLPVEDFYKELDRVLKPNGIVALICMDFPYLTINGKRCDVLTDMQMDFWNDPIFDKYKPSFYKVNTARTLYEAFKFPYPETRWLEHTTLKKTFNLTGLFRQLTGLPVYTAYLNDEDKPKDYNPMDKIIQTTRQFLGQDGSFDDFMVTNNYILFVTMARKPAH